MLMQCQPIDGNDDICYVYSDLQSDIDKLAGRIECNSDTNVWQFYYIYDNDILRNICLVKFL